MLKLKSRDELEADFKAIFKYRYSKLRNLT